MQQVRLPLLSDHALKYIINEPSLFSKNEDCFSMLKEVIEDKKHLLTEISVFSLHLVIVAVKIQILLFVKVVIQL